MLTTRKHLTNATRPKSENTETGNTHGLTPQQITQLPDLLAAPVILADSPTDRRALLAVLNDTDPDGLPLMAVIHPNGWGTQHGQRVEANFIKSVYGRKNLHTYLYARIGRQGIIYYNPEQGDKLTRHHQLHALTRRLVPASSYKKIIRPPRAVISTDPSVMTRIRLEKARKHMRPQAITNLNGHQKPVPR